MGSASAVFCWPLSELFSLDYIIRVGGGGAVSRGGRVLRPRRWCGREKAGL